MSYKNAKKAESMAVDEKTRINILVIKYNTDIPLTRSQTVQTVTPSDGVKHSDKLNNTEYK